MAFGQEAPLKTKFFGPDILRRGGGLPREGVGAKKFGMPLETQGRNQTFGRDIPGLLPGYFRGCPKSLRKKSLCSIFGRNRGLLVDFFVDFFLLVFPKANDNNGESRLCNIGACDARPHIRQHLLFIPQIPN